MASEVKVDLEFARALMEHHRFYITRNWQYFGAILLIDSLVFNAYADLRSDDDLVTTISLTSVALIGIFYHLINWTDMRIDRNAERINSFVGGELVEQRRDLLEGLIPWMKLGVVIAAIPHVVLAGHSGKWLMVVELGTLSLFMAASETVVRRARGRTVGVLQTLPDKQGAREENAA
jgi:hypothetical protein